MKRILLILPFVMPAVGVAQINECVQTGGPTPTEILAHRYVKRTTINNLQSQAGTWVRGTYAGNWDTYVEQAAFYEGSLSHFGTDTTQNGDSTVTFNDTPSSNGTGTYSNSNYHEANCDKWPFTTSTGTSGDTQQVDAPEIENLPHGNALWYFGSGTPSAVPANVGYGGGYAFQYANLTYNKNCLGNDTCSGNPTWGEIDTEGAISVSSSGVVTSTAGHANCQYDSAVTATLNSWTVSTPGILVNWPTGVTKPSTESVESIRWQDSGGVGDGYMTKHPWQVNDNCNNAIPSMAVNETFGTFDRSGVTSGWPNPAEGHHDKFFWQMPSCGSCPVFGGQYFFVDVIGADSLSSTWNPDPVYTGSGPSYTYNTVILKNTDQEWHIGTETNGSGLKIFDGEAKWFRDHGSSTQ